MKRLAACVITLGLGLGMMSGCASSGGGWTKPGMTQDQLKKDTSDCLLDATKMGPGGNQVVDQPRYRGCMAGRGYTVAPN